MVVSSGFALSKRSLANLEGVHPDLVRVVKRAIEITRVDFGVSEGLRTLERQKQLKEEGKSTTLKSRHLKQADGYGHAVDLYALDKSGKATWKHEDFRPVIQALMTAAIELDVQIQAGALWRTFLDSPHIQLNPEYYA
ncbi:MAG: M15 family metallopeptidase [Gammaproteobacteria bacterium]|nr:M15 family metallopeptidase [Gammaproteobacteria bacterium]